MSEWTRSATMQWERYCARVRASLVDSGADPSEVIDDLRRHLDTEVTRAGLAVVTEDDLRRLLERLGGGELAAAPEPPAVPDTPKPKPAAASRPGWDLLILGVLLPVFTLVWEWTTHFCAASFFDPIPTFWHGVLIATVPGANLLVHLRVRRGGGACPPVLGWANGLALGVAAFYSVMFLPVTLPGLLAILIFGLGLLPLSPILSLFASMQYRRHLWHWARADGTARLGGLWQGSLVAVTALLLLEAPELSTRIGCELACSEEPATQARGIRWLRAVGHRPTLLRFCYEPPRRFGDFFTRVLAWSDGSSGAFNPEAARNLFFRVYGQPFNAEPPPRLYVRGGLWREGEEGFTWEGDSGQGGEAVAGRVRGLSMVSSRLDGAVDARGAVAYLEWTFEFKNVAESPREARAQILLPAGGVVSRLTLWVNGEEREAAFASRAQTRAAYQDVAIVRRRDPVLVTTAGPDRVLLQCFPVPPQGGRMKVRLGVTAPLDLEDPGRGALGWPRFLERNFNLAPELSHEVWLSSRGPLATRAAGFSLETNEPGRFVLRGACKDSVLADPASAAFAERPRELREVWTTNDASGQAIRQTLALRTSAPPARVAIVVDGSQGMSDAYPALADALASLPDGLDLRVVLADDVPAELLPSGRGGRKAALDLAAERLRGLRGRGGQDNLPALNLAWDWAAQSTNGAVLWLHGPQPVLLSSIDGLRQRLERRGYGPPVYALPSHWGPDRLTERMEGVEVWRRVSRYGALSEDLRRLFQRWRQATPSVVVARERLPAPQTPAAAVSKHVERLWAFDEARRLGRERQVDAAVDLAARYQLVTPVTGAVVLETQAQYQEAGLTPAAPATVPVIPEPATWTLLALGALLLGGWRRTVRAPGHRRSC